MLKKIWSFRELVTRVIKESAAATVRQAPDIALSPVALISAVPWRQRIA